VRQDESHDQFTPQPNLNGSENTPYGVLELGARVASSAQSAIFRIVGHPNMLIKYPTSHNRFVFLHAVTTETGLRIAPGTLAKLVIVLCTSRVGSSLMISAAMQRVSGLRSGCECVCPFSSMLISIENMCI
jgi:hypothetical protein